MDPIIEQEHPIPQQISAYEFHLVGDMTLKQFFQVAAGVIISLILYGSSLPAYVKWPLILISFLTGVGFAFFPLQDRPLSTWLYLFIKAIYSPTTYRWHKTSSKRQIFLPEEQGLPKNPQTQTEPTKAVDVALPKPSIVSTMQNTPTPPIIKSAQNNNGILTRVNVTQQKPPEIIPTVKPIKPLQDEIQNQLPQENVGTTITPMTTHQVAGAIGANFSPDAAPPAPPNKPNVIVGQVINYDGSIVEGAILEIKDDEGRPVRALKTNRLGHFMIVTPLLNGNYQIITEKEGLVFDPINFTAEGSVLSPIAIHAKATDVRGVKQIQ